MSTAGLQPGGFSMPAFLAGVELKEHLEPLSEPVFVDRDMWERIVLNLMSNAFKYTLRGAIDVRLSQTDTHAA